jgi:hypothetical protein
MTDVFPRTVRILAELASPEDGEAFTRTIAPALRDLLASLEIPVTPEFDIVSGSGRVLIGRTAPRFVGAPAPGARTLRPEDLWGYASQFVTEDLATEIWRLWHPARADEARDSRFVTAFRQLLNDGVELGFRVGRFREASRALDRNAPPALWAECFEAVVGAEDAVRVRLTLGREQFTQLIASPTVGEIEWAGLVDSTKEGLFTELGLPMPKLSVSADAALPTPYFRCEWNDLHLAARIGLRADEIHVNDTVDRLRLMNVPNARERENPATRQPSANVPITESARLQAAGLTTWDARGYLLLAMAQLIRSRAAAFVTTSVVEFWLLTLEQQWPELVASVRARFPMVMLAQVIRGLAAEQVSIRDLPTVFNAMLLVQSTLVVDPRRRLAMPQPGSGTFITTVATRVEDLTWRDYVVAARRALKRTLATKLSRGTNTLVVYLLDAGGERRLAAGDRLTKADRDSLLDAVEKEAEHLPPTAQRPYLLVSPDVRARLRDELSPELREFFVLAHDELPGDLNVQPVARISTPFGA